MVEYSIEELHKILEEEAKKRALQLNLKYQLTAESLVASPKQTLTPTSNMQKKLEECLVDDLAAALFPPTPKNRLNEPNQENQKNLKRAKKVVLEFELQFKPDTPRLIMAPKFEPSPPGTLRG